MSTQMAAFAFGCLLLLVAILGGGFEIKELKVPKVGRASRLISCMFGMLFVVLGINPGFAEMLPGRRPAPKPPVTAPKAPAVERSATTQAGGAAATAQPQPPAPPAPKPRVEPSPRPRPRPSSSTKPRTDRPSASSCKAGKGTHWEQRPRVWIRRLKGACG